MYKGKFNAKNTRQTPAVTPVPENEKPVKEKPTKSKGSKTVTKVFYTCYFLLIIAFCAGMFFVHGFLVDWLTRFEAAQPTVKSEEVFDSLFSEPDWLALYDQAGLTDTVYEGKEEFNAYMTGLLAQQELTYAETSAGLSGDHKYLIRLGDQTIGYFTLTNKAEDDEAIPDWQLGEVHLNVNRRESVTIQKLDGHTAFVNGQAVYDNSTIQIISTVAEDYLPDGTSGVRLLRQQVNGLLVSPEVTIQDEDGNECEVIYDEATGIYMEQLPEAEEIPAELAQRAIEAGEAYSYFMVNRKTNLFAQYFVTGTETYRSIIGMDRWQQTSKSAAITGQEVSDYIRYTEDLYSVRVKMTMELTRKNDSIKEYPLDTTLFLENRKNGWKVIAMTNLDVTEQTNQVKLTFMNGDTELSSIFVYDDETDNVSSPNVTARAGQVFTGWAIKEVAEGGTITMTQVYTCDENFRLIVPSGWKHEPAVLYALFENAETVENIESVG